MLQSLWSLGDAAGLFALVILVVARQFVWRDAEPASMLRLPIVLTSTGAVWLLYALVHQPGSEASIFALAVEFVVVMITGGVMARFAQFRILEGHRQYRLTLWAVLIWAAFALVRAGGFLLAQRLGTSDHTTEPALLFALGLNRLTCSALVRRKVAVLERLQ